MKVLRIFKLKTIIIKNYYKEIINLNNIYSNKITKLIFVI